MVTYLSISFTLKGACFVSGTFLCSFNSGQSPMADSFLKASRTAWQFDVVVVLMPNDCLNSLLKVSALVHVFTSLAAFPCFPAAS